MKKISILLLFFLILSCNSKNDFALSGKVLFKGKPLYDAEVQVFLKQEKEKETPPIKVVSTDEKGVFTITLPKGKYFLVAKKKYDDEGEIDMLFGNHPENPIRLNSNITLKDWNLESKKAKNSFSKGVGIKGIVKGFSNFRNVRVYAYTDNSTGLKGPDYTNKTKIDKDGNFTIDLPKGSYFLVARERKVGNFGLLREGDFSGEYKNNPVSVKNEGYMFVDTINIKLVDKKKVAEINEKGLVEEGRAKLSGIIVDRNGKPAKNVYVLLYDNPEMVGRPSIISAPSNKDGKFLVVIKKQGKYYIGARSKIGGPAEPGELIGTYLGSSDKGVKIEEGKNVEIKIEVHEVW